MTDNRGRSLSDIFDALTLELKHEFQEQLVEASESGVTTTDESEHAVCHCGWPADWHKDKELCEVHAAEEWLEEGGME